MTLFKIRYKGPRGIESALIEANNSDEAGRVALAWCDDGCTDGTREEGAILRLLSVQPAIVAGPSILKPVKVADVAKVADVPAAAARPGR